MKLDYLYESILNWQKECRDKELDRVANDMDIMLKHLKKEMMDSEARKNGVKPICSAANRIIKRANIDSIKGVFINRLSPVDIRYCVTDGAVGVRFNSEMPLAKVDDKFADQPFNLSQFCKKG